MPDASGFVTTAVLNTKINGLVNQNRLWHKVWWNWKENHWSLL